MKRSISLRFSVVAVLGVVALNVALDPDLRPAFLQPALTADVRDALGCIDDGSGNLIDDYRRAIYMGSDDSIEPMTKFFQLKSLTSKASATIEDVQDCYSRLIAANAGVDSNGFIRGSLETLASAYEGIFLGQAITISRAIREQAGVNAQSSNNPKAPTPDIFIKTAEAAFAKMSAHIGAIVSR